MRLSVIVSGTVDEVHDGTLMARAEAIGRREHMTPIALKVEGVQIRVLLGPTPSVN